MEQLTESARSHIALYSGLFSFDSSTCRAYTDKTSPTKHSRKRILPSHVGTPDERFRDDIIRLSSPPFALQVASLCHSASSTLNIYFPNLHVFGKKLCHQYFLLRQRCPFLNLPGTFKCRIELLNSATCKKTAQCSDWMLTAS